MCSDPLDPGGEVRGSSVGCTIGMSDILAIRVAAALDLHRGLLELKICILRQVCFACGGIFFVFSMSLRFQIRRPRAVSVDSVKELRHSANLPTENSRPPIPTRCGVYCALT